MKVELSPGEKIGVVFEGTDGEITVSFDKHSIDVFADGPDTKGREGIIYRDVFTKGLLDDINLAPTDREIATKLLETLKDARYTLYGNGPGNPKIDNAIKEAEEVLTKNEKDVKKVETQIVADSAISDPQIEIFIREVLGNHVDVTFDIWDDVDSLLVESEQNDFLATLADKYCSIASDINNELRSIITKITVRDVCVFIDTKLHPF